MKAGRPPQSKRAREALVSITFKADPETMAALEKLQAQARLLVPSIAAAAGIRSIAIRRGLQMAAADMKRFSEVAVEPDES